MARLKKRLKADFDVPGDMTPLIDCIFLLLIFLMCTTEITKTQNDQNLILPYAKNAFDDQEPEERIVLNVYPAAGIANRLGIPGDADGVVTINGRAYNWGSLQAYLEQRARGAEKSQGGASTGNRTLIDIPVKIRGHRTAPFKMVQFTMIYCIDMAYWKISFGTYNDKDFKSPGNPLLGDTPKGTKIWFPVDAQRLFQ